MKIRNGFVSNSSSSSFILFGIKLENIDDYQEQCHKYLEKDAIDKYIKDTKQIRKEKKCNKCNTINDLEFIQDFEYCGNCGEKLEIIEILEDVDWSDLWYELSGEERYKISDIESLNDDGLLYLGKILAYGGDDYLDNDDISMTELTELSKKFNKHFGEECKLYYGTVAS